MILRGALPGRKPGTSASLDQFAELLVEQLVDVVAVDGDLDVLLARADVFDLDVLVELFRLFFLALFSAVAVPCRSAVAGRAAVRSLLGRDVVSSVMADAPPKVKKAEKSRRQPRSLATAILRPSRPKERVMGLEPTTATLATWRSTTELHPQLAGFSWRAGQVIPHTPNYKPDNLDGKGGCSRRGLHASRSPPLRRHMQGNQKTFLTSNAQTIQNSQ